MSKQAHVIAVYSLKGGVGKTSLAVNLAAEAALQAGGTTLLWQRVAGLLGPRKPG
jgi:chromosome partitioning protein